MAESLTRSRLEAFSDGVIAVIITIMVLEFKVPPVGQMTDRDTLLSNARIFAVYLLSFTQVGIYWVNHHYLLDDLETVTHGILWANLGLLFTLSLIPFGVQWIGTRGITPVPRRRLRGLLLPARARLDGSCSRHPPSNTHPASSGLSKAGSLHRTKLRGCFSRIRLALARALHDRGCRCALAHPATTHRGENARPPISRRPPRSPAQPRLFNT